MRACKLRLDRFMTERDYITCPLCNKRVNYDVADTDIRSTYAYRHDGYLHQHQYALRCCKCQTTYFWNYPNHVHGPKIKVVYSDER